MNYLICVVTYNRAKSLSRLLSSLVDAVYPNNNQYDLFISIDHSDCEKHILEICQEIKWSNGNFKILTYEKNMGLKAHMLKCISYVENYDGIFLLEDDLVVSKSFPLLIEQTKTLNSNLIAGTALYSYGVNEFANFAPFKPVKEKYDIYLMKVPCSWGEFWTRKQGLDFLDWIERKGEKILFDDLPAPARMWGEKSWKKQFYSYLIETNKYVIYPYWGFCTNMNESGVHNIGRSNVMQSYLIENIDNLCIPDNPEKLVKYDHYMESLFLQNRFENTSIDIYGIRKINDVKNRFLLSTQILDYKYINSWDLCLIPFEMNITKRLEGKKIFLYDLGEKKHNKRKCENPFMSYIPYVRGNWISHFKRLFASIKNSFINKIKSIVKKLKGMVL